MLECVKAYLTITEQVLVVRLFDKAVEKMAEEGLEKGNK